ncbi:hypothetical protein ACWC10_20475 [Streptomyces sp. NPDC001595]
MVPGLLQTKEYARTLIENLLFRSVPQPLR